MIAYRYSALHRAAVRTQDRPNRASSRSVSSSHAISFWKTFTRFKGIAPQIKLPTPHHVRSSPSTLDELQAYTCGQIVESTGVVGISISLNPFLPRIFVSSLRQRSLPAAPICESLIRHDVGQSYRDKRIAERILALPQRLDLTEDRHRSSTALAVCLALNLDHKGSKNRSSVCLKKKT